MTAIYHITHVKNLAAIVQAGGLLCDHLIANEAPFAVSIAHQHIKLRRAARPVQKLNGLPVAAGGCLCNYVPFYFAPRSPMLYTIDKGNVAGYTEGQRPILHLVSTAEAVAALGQPWAFTDGHAEMAVSDFFTELGALATEVDWSVMNSIYWKDTVDQPDRKWKRQAEFLVHQTLPWTAIQRIGVFDQDIRRQVELILSTVEHKPEIAVERGWYY